EYPVVFVKGLFPGKG
nr:RecName: Full=26 kDa cell wall protein [Phaseolus vulgaris]